MIKLTGLIHVLLYIILYPSTFRLMESPNLLYVVKKYGCRFS